MIIHLSTSHFLGVASQLPLWSSDVLFFNPKEPHCISSRSRAEDTVYCLLLYLKSANIGLNNNGIPLTPIQASLLAEYNLFHSKYILLYDNASLCVVTCFPFIIACVNEINFDLKDDACDQMPD